MSFISKIKIVPMAMVLGLCTVSNPIMAAAPTPVSGSAVIDGDYDEWDTSLTGDDFFAKMYEAGRPDLGKDWLSTLYMRYDCNTNTVFALVLRADNYWPQKEAQNAWIKINGINGNVVDGGDSPPNGSPPDFSWVPPDGIEGQTLIGWEASFELAPGVYTMEAHVNIIPGRTSSTGRGGQEIQLKLDCSVEPPTPDPNITVEKATNGKDADDPPEVCPEDPTVPNIPEGGDVVWTYVITNTGNVPLTDIVITDDMGAVISCDEDGDGTFEGDDFIEGPLDVNGVITCQATDTAVAGAYENTATVDTADYIDPETGEIFPVEPATDPSHYCGVPPDQPNVPAIDIEKSTNDYDDDTPNGHSILFGEEVIWIYQVTNTGNVDLVNVVVTDDQLPSSAIACDENKNGIFEAGEDNIIASLPENDVVYCQATGIAAEGADGSEPFEYANKGTVNGCYEGDPEVAGDEQCVSDEDPSHYYGVNPELDLEKHTQGFDADDPTGPYIEVGDTVYWLYQVKNTGNVDLTNVVVTDDKLADTEINCGGTDEDNVIELLAVGDTLNCTATGIATLGQYENNATAKADDYVDDSGNTKELKDEDPSHYYGIDPGLDIIKEILDIYAEPPQYEDANVSPGVFFIAGDPITWRYTIENTGNIDLADVAYTDLETEPNPGMLVTMDCGAWDADNDGDIDLLAQGATVECYATGTAILGQYANEACVAADYTVYTQPDPEGEPVPDTRTAKDCDPSHYYGFIANQPSLEVFDLGFTISGDANQYLNGEFTIENASDGPEVTAIGITNIDMTLEYRTKASKGNKWTDIEVSGNCVYDPTVPFVFEGSDGAQMSVTFACTAAADQIPLDATSIRVTACVDIFNRDGKTFCYSTSGDLSSGIVESYQTMLKKVQFRM